MAMRVPGGRDLADLARPAPPRSSIAVVDEEDLPAARQLLAGSPRPAARGSQRQTKVRMASRSAGGVAMIEISRSPPIAICSVRGMGVAVSVSTSTWVRSSLSRSLWVTPKRCSSSMTSRPRSLKRTSRDSSRCVPTTTSSLPSASAASVFCCSALLRKRDSTATRTGKSANRSEKVTKCCSASTVVGASTATCLPPSTASSARAAPPRSCRSRRRRRSGGPSARPVCMSASTVSMAFAWSGVSSKGKVSSNARNTASGAREGVAGQRRPLRVELHQLLGDLARLGRDPPALLLPGLAAQLVEPDGVGLAARVAVDEADPVDGHVDRRRRRTRGA